MLLHLDFINMCTYIVCMKELTFVWDDKKELANRAKHDGISFDEAKTVFYDEYARLIFDPDHSNDE